VRDPITRGISVGAGVFGFLRAWKRNRKANRAEKREARDEVLEDFNSTDDEVSMDYKAFAVQAVLAGLRHLMTAAPFAGLTVSDDWLVQTATVLVGIGGFLWSLKRKVPAKPAE
jgi:hypothetical protein